MIKVFTLVGFILICLTVQSQDIAFARRLVDTLTSPHFWGRGYTKNGMKKAGDYIADQYKIFGLMPVDGKSFKQHFKYSANIFPGRMELTINGKNL